MSIVSVDNYTRYLRQLPLIGDAGQQKLATAHVCIAGAGGLGSPIALYLAAAGVGALTLIDCDTVAESNLNRQILHTTHDIGKKKVDSAAEKLHALNPEISIKTYHSVITQETISDMAKGADIIVDAVDNYAARHVLNTYCVNVHIPFVHGAVQGFFGQMMVIIPKKTACLYCFLQPQEAENEPPIIGSTAGMVGLMQANETIKYLTGIGTVSAGTLVLWDGMKVSLEKCIVEKNPNCSVCQ
jgi:adenylyltransferase/sulfurtransferase